MTEIIILSVIIGAVSGYFWLPEVFIEHSETVLNVGLCLLLFMAGIDIGRQKTVLQDIKKNGLSIIAVPVLVIAGTFAGAATASIFVGYSLTETLTVSSGFGWYSLAPLIIAEHSAELSAVTFLSNMARELFAIILIPVVAKYIGYIEACAPAGAASMDTCLPIVERATNSTVAVYSFVSGVILTIVVPFLTPTVMGLI